MCEIVVPPGALTLLLVMFVLTLSGFAGWLIQGLMGSSRYLWACLPLNFRGLIGFSGWEVVVIWWLPIGSKVLPLNCFLGTLIARVIKCNHFTSYFWA